MKKFNMKKAGMLILKRKKSKAQVNSVILQDARYNT